MHRVDYVRPEFVFVHAADHVQEEEELECRLKTISIQAVRKIKTISIQDPYMIDWEIASHVVECVVEDYKLIITSITNNNKDHAVAVDSA